jgi:hypothetical protein
VRKKKLLHHAQATHAVKKKQLDTCCEEEEEVSHAVKKKQLHRAHVTCCEEEEEAVTPCTRDYVTCCDMLISPKMKMKSSLQRDPEGPSQRRSSYTVHTRLRRNERLAIERSQQTDVRDCQEPLHKAQNARSACPQG